jgi:hypothetical protein
MLLHFVMVALAACCDPGPGLAPAELILLLEIGVGEEEIIAFAETRGGFQPLDAEVWATVESLGAGSALLGRLVRLPPEFGVISELARASDVFADRQSGLSFVHPAGWGVTKSSRDGATLVWLAPKSAVEPRAFLSPCLFVFLQPESGLVPDAGSAALAALSRGLVGRLRDAGVRPVAGPSGAVTVHGRPCETVRFASSRDGTGVLEIEFVVDERGRAVGVGFTAPAGDAEAVRKSFERLAASLTLR